MILSSITSFLFLFFGYIIFIYMVIVIVAYSLMLLFALFNLKRDLHLETYISDEEHLNYTYSKPVSIIVPAYNEEVGIVNSVQSLLSLGYPQVEILVINDGSNDTTEQQMIDHFQMVPITKVIRQQLETEPILAIFESTIHPNITLITKENGGKADALNTGINASKYPYFCSIDGDSMLDNQSLLKVMRPIIESNGDVIAAGGSVRIANGFDIQLGTVTKASLSKKPIVVMQTIEYLRAFLMGRVALSRFNLALIISGAFSVFSKEWVIRAGGYSRKTLGEDMELIVRLHRLIRKEKVKKKVIFVAEPACWTEAPENYKDLRKQRRRWHQGLLESIWIHKRMMLNPKYGTIGLVSFPYFWLIESIGPFIELSGYIYIFVSFLLGDIYYIFAILLSLLLILYGSVFSIVSVLLEAWSLRTFPKISDTFRLFLYSMSEVFWYRPITLIWRCEGIIYFLIRKKEWGKLKRKGLSKSNI